MRLVWRLVLSHTLLAAILLGGLGWSLSSLARLNDALGDLITRDLGNLGQEESLHRAAWGVEVAVRHGWAQCAQGRPEGPVALSIRGAADRLRRETSRVGRLAPAAIRAAAGRYLALARRLVSGPTCRLLRSPALHREELDLDERLTGEWIARLVVLHDALKNKEEGVRRSAVRAVVIGGSVGAIALAVALLVAPWIARGVTVPLRVLASCARRLGRGDFTPIPETPGPPEVVALSSDLDRMRAQLQEIDSLKQSFLASVSHELRTPLAKIREALALLGDGAAGPLGERQGRVVAIAREACEREIRLVGALLDLSRLRAGQPVRRDSAVDLDEVVRRAVVDEEPEAVDRGVSITVHLDGDVPRSDLDAALVERAIANLVRNAVSVSPPGEEVTVERELVTTGPEGRPGTWGRVTVRDRGPGVPPEHRATLFQPFVSRELAGHPDRLGVGLGLSLAREVARAHGGDADVLSVPGPGATFVIWLPLDVPRPPPLRSPRRNDR